jgi:Pentapeptide repeats (8 copies)/NACHT domain
MHAPLSREDRKSKRAQQRYLWRHFCQRVFKPMCWIVVSVLLTAALSFVVNFGSMPTNTQWSTVLIISLIMTHQLPVVILVAVSISLFIFFWWQGHEVSQKGRRGEWRWVLQGKYQEQMGEIGVDKNRYRRLSLSFMNKPDAVGKKSSVTYDPDTSLLEVFYGSEGAHDERARALLVLGKAGAGKSTLLLEFAREYIKQADRKPGDLQCIPLILPLAHWGREPLSLLSLEEWICVQCEDSYGFSTQKCRQFLQNGQILPLLDGLDEVAESKRMACIQAINTYRKDEEVPMIVSSCTEEYESASASEKLNLLQAIEILPLETEQVKASFNDTHLKALLDVYQSNVHLQELATTPLIVNMLREIYWGQHVDANEFSDLQGTKLLRSVLDKYVKHMLEQPHHGRSLPFSPHHMKAWLTWLAYHLQIRRPLTFSLELLEPDWLSPSYQTRYARSRRWLGKGLSALLLVVLVNLPETSVSLRLLLALVILCGYWPYRRLFSSWIEERSRAERQSLEDVLRIMEERDHWDQLDESSRRDAISRHRARASRLARASQSAKGWMIFEVLSGPLLGLVSGLLFRWIGGPTLGLHAALFIGVIAWLISLPLLLKNVVAKQYMLRLWLQSSGAFPWHAVTFLKEARIRRLLQRDGKGYSFPYALFLDYFADCAFGNLLWEDSERWNRWRQKDPDRSVELQEANLRGIRLCGTDLHKANLSHTNLSHADLIATNFSDAVLREANLSRSKHWGNKFIRADLTKACLKSARFSYGGGDFRGSDLREAILIQADLSKADLSLSDLRGANLNQANFRGTILSAVNLQGAKLSGTKLEKARLLDKTDLRGVTGLTKGQLEACKAKGAII